MQLRHANNISGATITRIGLFIDGGYFSHVSTYYRYHHEGGNFLSLAGVKELIRHRIADLEGSSADRCRVVESHYYRGRISAKDAQERNLLFGERVFDDALLYSGVETHYRPVSQGKERGIDVLLALEAYHMTVTKGLDVCVLFAGDGDFIPLVRKLHGLGTRVMVLGFNLQTLGNDGKPLATRCSFHLLQEASYPVMLSEEIDMTPAGDHALLDAIFLPRHENQEGLGVSKLSPLPYGERIPNAEATEPENKEADSNALRWTGHVCYLQESFGFLLRDGDNKRFFFHQSDLVDLTYQELSDGLGVNFLASSNERGPCAKKIYRGT